ncbi:MAG: methylcobamide--CoM methyltransferase [Chloroflexi bacterium]|nr:methylcobamide--CoM methyltransferase [Chloroflexota bacterium]
MLTTVVGNYPRIGPDTRAPNLRTAIHQYERRRITQEELRQVEDEVTREVIQEQVEAGIDLVTDGQVRWEDSQTYFARRIRGMELDGLSRYFDTNTYYRRPVAKGKVEWQGPISVEDFRFAQSHSPRPVKPVVTGPYTLARLSQLDSSTDLASLVLDLAAILNLEAQALEQAGATIIQFDEPAILKHQEDFPLFRKAAKVLTRGLRAKTELRTYFRDASGLAPDLFRLPFQVFGLDFAWGPRNYVLLQGFPGDKELVMGIMDARNTRLETVEELVEAVRRGASHVALDRLSVSPSCGLEFLPRENARQKLVRLVEGARKAAEVLA